MLKIEDVRMNNRYKYLDVMCFPDLYPKCVIGQRKDTETLHCRIIYLSERD